MANRVYIEDISQYDGKTVEIWGWLYNMRSGGKLRFLLVRDGTGLIQAVVSKADVSEEIFTATDSLTQESSIKIIFLIIQNN